MSADHRIIDVFVAAHGSFTFTGAQQSPFSSRNGVGYVTVIGTVKRKAERLRDLNLLGPREIEIQAINQALRPLSEQNNRKKLHVTVHTDNADAYSSLQEPLDKITFGENWSPPLGYSDGQRKFCGLVKEFAKVEIVCHSAMKTTGYLTEAHALAAKGSTIPIPEKYKRPPRSTEKRKAIENAMESAQEIAEATAETHLEIEAETAARNILEELDLTRG